MFLRNAVFVYVTTTLTAPRFTELDVLYLRLPCRVVREVVIIA